MNTFTELMLADLGMAQLVSVSGLAALTFYVKAWVSANAA